MSEVSTDIKEATERKNISVKMTDDKISCNFNYESGNYNDKSYKSAYYVKVFDSWEDFTSYAEEFFKI